MLMILTNSQDATADHLASVLAREGIRVVRLDTDTALQHVTFHFSELTPVLHFDEALYQPDDFTNVWYRRPERLRHPRIGDTPEGKFLLDEWTEALEGFFAHVPRALWMNHPASNVAASHKLEQLTAASRLGFKTPETLVTQDADLLRVFFARCEGRVIVKPLAKGYVDRSGEGDSLIYTNEVTAADLQSLEDLVGCPTLFQRYIDKRADIRVTVVDRDIHAVEMIATGPNGCQRCDIRRNNMEDVAYQIIEVPQNVRNGISVLMGYYGLRFAAIDFTVDRNGEWYFLEVNPNGQWAWTDLIGVTDIAESFVRSFRR